VPPDIRISIDHGADLQSPAGEAVLAGLMAFNLSRLPKPEGSFAVTGHDPENDTLLAGMTVVVYGATGYSHWGGWAVPAAAQGPALPAVIARAMQELGRRGVRRLEVGLHPHFPVAPYRMAGLTQILRQPDHMLGGDYLVHAMELVPGTLPPVPGGISLGVREPVSKALGRELRRQIDGYRQRQAPARFRWVACILRQDGQVKGGAICYAADTDFMVDMLWLDESLRGTGYGREIMECALDAGRAMGCTRAGVETMDCQAPHFYPRLGFVRTGYHPSAVPGMGMTLFQMRL